MVLEVVNPKQTEDNEVFGYVPYVKIGKAELWFTRRYCYLIMPYNRKVMERLKKGIPREYREWLPKVKRWRIHRACEDNLIMVLEPD